ncbi:hypothetical protein ACWD6I_13955 [Streptomyces sp. NPDC002454]
MPSADEWSFGDHNKGGGREPVAREGGEPPRFGDYYPALKEPYERLRAVPG